MNQLSRYSENIINMANKIRVALAQTNIVWENKTANRKICERFVKQAAAKKADLIVFPEMTLTGFSMDVKKVSKDEKNSPSVEFFKKLAKRYSTDIIFGIVLKSGKKGTNNLLMANKSGKISAKYRKIHSFSLAGENKYYEAGNKLEIINYKGFKISFLICYDLRFAGLAQALSKRRLDVLFIIANWPKQRAEHWRALLKARALDLQSYVVGINRVGSGKGNKYAGDSMVIAPDGEIKLHLKNQSLRVAELNKKNIGEYRKEFPFLKDLKNNLYPRL